MLLVSGFKPFMENSNKRNSKNNSFRQSTLPYKSDSVSFSASTLLARREVGRLTPSLKLDPLTSELVRRTKKDPVFVAFKRTFLDPLYAELEKKGISLNHKRYGGQNIPVDKNPEHLGDINEVFAAYFRRKETDPPRVRAIDDDKLFRTYGCSESRNKATVQLLANSEDGVIRGRHGIVELPMPLVVRAKQIDKALKEFQETWLKLPYDDSNLKVQKLQLALKTLMPEN